MKNIITCAIVLSFFMASCNEDPLNMESNVIRKARVSSTSGYDDIKDNLDMNVIKPLALRNEWTYFSRWVDTSGKTTESFFTLSIDETMVENGQTWYIMYRDINNKDAVWQTNKADGLHIKITEIPFPDILEAKYPAKIGDSWQYDAFYRTVMAVDTMIDVPAGKFPCIYYLRSHEYDNSSAFMQKTYYSPGIGMVKYEKFVRDSGKADYYLQNIQGLKAFSIQTEAK